MSETSPQTELEKLEAETGNWGSRVKALLEKQHKDGIRLIAAAPDLAEALEDARKRLQGAGMLGGSDDPVNAALAKARGE